MILTFDCYGTLIDTNPLIHEIGSIAQEAGVSRESAETAFQVNEARVMYGEPYQDYPKVIEYILQYCDAQFGADVFQKEYHRVMDTICHLEAFPEVKPILRDLKNAGHQLYLLSNSHKEIMTHHLDTLGNLFEYEFLADELHCYKPQYEFFRYTEDKLHLNPDIHCHIAEGFFWDIVPASRFRWNTIWVNRNHLTGSDRGGRYQEVSDLTEVPPLISFFDAMGSACF